MSESKGVPFFASPALQTAEGQQELNQMIQERDELDYQCFCLLKETLDSSVFGDLIEYLANEDSDRIDTIIKLHDRVEAVLEHRNHLTNRMLELVSGRR